MMKLKSFIAALAVFILVFSGTLHAQRHAKGYSPVGRLGYPSQRQLPPELAVEVVFQEPSGNNILDAGETGKLIATIKNTGKGDANKLLVTLTPLLEFSHVGFLERNTIPPVAAGSMRRIAVSLVAAEEMPSQTLRFRLQVIELQYRVDADPVDIELPAEALKPPKLVLAEYGIDDSREGLAQGNNNGRIELGETIEVTAYIQNRGLGTAEEVVVRLDEFPAGIMTINLNKQNNRILLRDTLRPSEWREVRFAFVVTKLYTGIDIPFTLMLQERRPQFSTHVSERLPVNQDLKRRNQIVIRGQQQSPSEVKASPFPELNIDIEQDIPETLAKNMEAVAVVIGISRYSSKDVADVSYATRDATLMRDYLIEQFGYDPANVISLIDENATKGAFESVLDAGGQLANLVKPGRSDVFIYFSGHGAPGLEDRQRYLVPFDCQPDFVQHSGYALSRFYKSLADLNAKSVTVVLDACFSGGTAQGGMLISQISPIFIQTRNPLINIPNGAVFTAASSDQVAIWYEEKKHGLFTYFFLKGLKGEADRNADRAITVAEMKEYLLEQVPYNARRLRNKSQTPNVSASDLDLELARY